MINNISCKKIYMLQEQSRLINAMISIARDCFFSSTYYQILKDSPLKDTRGDWIILTQNSYYDLTVLNWCKLFGTNSEPTHYSPLLNNKFNFKKLIQNICKFPPNRSNMKKYFLSDSGLDEKMYETYWRETIDYRNRNLIHYVHDPKLIKDHTLKFPIVSILHDTSFNLLNLLREICENYQSNQDPAMYEVKYESFSNKKSLEKYIESTCPACID